METSVQMQQQACSKHAHHSHETAIVTIMHYGMVSHVRIPSADKSSPTSAHTGPAARPLEDSIDEESINVLNSRISNAGRVSLDDEEASAAPVEPLRSTSDDSSLAASFNQRLKQLSVDEDAYDGPLTGASWMLLSACLSHAGRCLQQKASISAWSKIYACMHAWMQS